MYRRKKRLKSSYYFKNRFSPLKEHTATKPHTDILILSSHNEQVYRQNFYMCYCMSVLGGSLVTTAWRVLRLRMEETASRYVG
jgi:hypothetical protein